MAYRKDTFMVGKVYHIYNRGVNKMTIFFDNTDKDRFIKLLYICNSEKSAVFRNVKDKALNEIDIEERLVDIGAYCLMGNHFHLIIKEKVENGITKFMSKLMTAYAMYFNKKYERRGILFEKPFKSKYVGLDDAYCDYLFLYVHFNPLKLIEPNWKEKGVVNEVKSKQFLEEYKYSSYCDYYTDIEREELLILNKEEFPERIFETKDFKKLLARLYSGQLNLEFKAQEMFDRESKAKHFSQNQKERKIKMFFTKASVFTKETPW